MSPELRDWIDGLPDRLRHLRPTDGFDGGDVDFAEDLRFAFARKRYLDEDDGSWGVKPDGTDDKGAFVWEASE